MIVDTKSGLLTRTEALEQRKNDLEKYIREINKKLIPGETWEIWREIIDTSILIEEINIELAKENIKSYKDSLQVYKNY